MTEGSRRPRVVTRRNFLYLSGLAATGVVATACGGGAPLPGATPQAPATTGAQPTSAAQPQATAVPAPTLGVQQAPRGVQASPTAQGAAAPAVTARKEAPQLAALVREGKLPPVEQRLPKAPLVVQPIEKVGKYGGTWRNVILGGADLATLTTTIGYEHLVRWDRDWDNIVPNVAESYEVNADGSEFTFKLREGHKWSDGQPFTADDIMFWYEDVSLNKDLNPGGFGSWLKSGGKDVVVEKIDNRTVKFKFAAPNGLFLSFMCTANGSGITQYPKHYAQQFHKKYNPDGVERLAREANQDGWIRLFQTKCSGIPGTPYNAVWQNPELPTLHAWDITAPFTGTTRVTAERNPYCGRPLGLTIYILESSVHVGLAALRARVATGMVAGEV